MATPTIPNLDDDTKAQLPFQAAHQGHTMEEGDPSLLRQGVIGSAPQPPREGMGSRILGHFARLGEVDLDLPARSDQPNAPDLTEVNQ